MKYIKSYKEYEFLNENQISENIKQAIDFKKDFLKKYPEHKEEVNDYFELMQDEIEDGGSTSHEIELFINSCKDLLKENSSKLDEGRKSVQLKRKYGERSAITAGKYAPVRNRILGHIAESENGKVSREDLKEFIAGMNEDSETKTTFSWVSKNSKYFKTVKESDGTITYKLSKLGQRALNRSKINEEVATTMNTPGMGNVVPGESGEGSGDKIDDVFKKYKRSQIAEIREVTEDDIEKFDKEKGKLILSNDDSSVDVSISDADLKGGSPKIGDMIARNPKNHKDQWLIAKDYFTENFEEL